MMDKKQKILDVLTSNYNVNLFSENGRLHIAQKIVDALENKSMPEFGDDVITKEKAEKMASEKVKAESKAKKNKVSKIRSAAKKITK
tara:strand:- start:459 stop:719 length:261 start_codon:yes stop_codon:yes gene_type:complete